ncbi:AbrB/MazE/SpoVT family DNA-binding domain-containing protein [Chelativorans sp. AA-79]|uniref:AbrB/MazE/SpoVT family DNA-binding domain-containing protein n=1 Tax=Chelativorans sp. AA-79 TaxID=3028735 RepID=UPI0023F980D7|nr:AbrB/MazE/SpoVT family DNA-binding domain-containing protein [Chelativorans sp. AA-79]WEX10211.1 AbrB/MazE/SpoVT family DNA-binding domain-containing protein [Chelativorans sp. AA-79]
MRVSRWGNSLAIRLPSSVVQLLKLEEGDEIELHAQGMRSLAVAKKPEREELLTRLRHFRGKLPADFRFDRDELNAR